MTRLEIVQCARTWLGTPFRHQGRLKGVGVDCVGLPLCVLAELGFSDWVGQYAVYPAQPRGTEVLETCRRILIEKPFYTALPGDIIVFNMFNRPTHVAIGSDIGMIHAYAGGKKQVVEHIIDSKWMPRVAACFEIPGITS